jgi:tetratricopeptide (TPR) repeat protein
MIAALRHLPFMVSAFSRVADATSRRDWTTIVSTIEELHAKGLDSDDTHYRLGCAYAMLGKWTEAVRQFEAIKSALPKPRDNARRFFNYALALTLMGRRDESLGVLRSSSSIADWPAALRAKAEQLMQHLKEGNVPPPDVQ